MKRISITSALLLILIVLAGCLAPSKAQVNYSASASTGGLRIEGTVVHNLGGTVYFFGYENSLITKTHTITAPSPVVPIGTALHSNMIISNKWYSEDSVVKINWIAFLLGYITIFITVFIAAKLFKKKTRKPTILPESSQAPLHSDS